MSHHHTNSMKPRGRTNYANNGKRGGNRPRMFPERQFSNEGIYANSRVTHTVTTLMGANVQVHVRNGDVFEGVLKTMSPQIDVVLEQVHQVDVTFDETTKKLIVPEIGVKIPRQEELKDVCVYKMCDVILITASNQDLDFATKESFTDSGITNKTNGQSHDDMKELQPWFGDEGDDITELGDINLNGTWDVEDMLRTNQEKFNVKSDYDPSLEQYTTPLRQENTEVFRQREAKAERLAREIEKSDFHKRGAELENGDGQDEEAMFSSVTRPGQPKHNSNNTSSNSVNNNTTNNTAKYIPPHQRQNTQSNQGRVTRGANNNNQQPRGGNQGGPGHHVGSPHSNTSHNNGPHNNGPHNSHTNHNTHLNNNINAQHTHHGNQQQMVHHQQHGSNNNMGSQQHNNIVQHTNVGSPHASMGGPPHGNSPHGNMNMPHGVSPHNRSTTVSVTPQLQMAHQQPHQNTGDSQHQMTSPSASSTPINTPHLINNHPPPQMSDSPHQSSTHPGSPAVSVPRSPSYKSHTHTPSPSNMQKQNGGGDVRKSDSISPTEASVAHSSPQTSGSGAKLGTPTSRHTTTSNNNTPSTSTNNLGKAPKAPDAKLQELKKFGETFSLKSATPATTSLSTPAVKSPTISPAVPPKTTASTTLSTVPPTTTPQQATPTSTTPSTAGTESEKSGRASTPSTGATQEADSGETAENSGSVKSTLNPNAKEFVLNPNAKPFTPPTTAPTPPAPVVPPTPQQQQPHHTMMTPSPMQAVQPIQPASTPITPGSATVIHGIPGAPGIAGAPPPGMQQAMAHNGAAMQANNYGYMVQQLAQQAQVQQQQHQQHQQQQQQQNTQRFNNQQPKRAVVSVQSRADFNHPAAAAAAATGQPLLAQPSQQPFLPYSMVVPAGGPAPNAARLQYIPSSHPGDQQQQHHQTVYVSSPQALNQIAQQQSLATHGNQQQQQQQQQQTPQQQQQPPTPQGTPQQPNTSQFHQAHMNSHQHQQIPAHSQNQQIGGHQNPQNSHTSPSPIQHHSVHAPQGGPQHQIPGAPQQIQPPSTSTPGPVFNTIYPPIQQHAHTPTSPLHPMPPGAAHYPYPQGQNMMIPNLQQHQQVAYVQHGQPPSSIPGSAQPGNQPSQQAQQPQQGQPVNHQGHNVHHNQQGVPLGAAPNQQPNQQGPQILMMAAGGQQAPGHLPQQLPNTIQALQSGQHNLAMVGHQPAMITPNNQHAMPYIPQMSQGHPNMQQYSQQQHQ